MPNEYHFSGNVPGHITILEGKKLEEKHPVKLVISGDINAVTNFLAQRTEPKAGSGLQTVNPTTTIVFIDEEKMHIALHLEPNNPFGTEVNAHMEYTEDFLQWSINKATTLTREQFVKLLRFGKRFFDSPDKHEEVLKAYMSLQVSAQSEVQASSDTRGNKKGLFDKQVNSQNIPTEFVLYLRIFKGMAQERFRVEVCLDVTDSSVRFWLESPELVELIDKRKKEIFAAVSEHLTQYPVIYK